MKTKLTKKEGLMTLTIEFTEKETLLIKTLSFIIKKDHENKNISNEDIKTLESMILKNCSIAASYIESEITPSEKNDVSNNISLN